ncbi:MAG TPA: ankyrin repeat domain-containing protein [Terriglobales bacterium]|nr:ankyrin repeat domain-containing protein [Terriglobales bacterium]
MSETRKRRFCFAFGLLFMASSVCLASEEKTDTKPVDVSIYNLAMDPQKFDAQLVRVQALLTSGWEGDAFLSDPDPQNMPSGKPAYLWFYRGTKYSEHNEVASIGTRGSVLGWFTGYFHYVANPHIVNGAFFPGHFQLEATETRIFDKQPWTLAQAIRQGNMEKVRELLQAGAKVNVWDEFQVSPLFEATNSNHPDITEELLKSGADPKLTDLDGSTPLMTAAWNGDIQSARLLLDRGALVNAANAHGETALIFASQTCPDGEMVQMLLDAGADRRSEALMAAAGTPIVAEKLIKSGADLTFKDSLGRTIEDQSCHWGDAKHYEVCILVRQALGKK